MHYTKGCLFRFLLGSELSAVTAFLLSAVLSTEGKTSIALSANHLVAVVLSGEDLERRLDDTTTQSEDEVEGRLLLDVVIRERATVLELLAGEDEALLVRGDAFLVLNLSLDILDGVRGLDLEGDCLASQSLNENLHFRLCLMTLVYTLK